MTSKAPDHRISTPPHLHCARAILFLFFSLFGYLCTNTQFVLMIMGVVHGCSAFDVWVWCMGVVRLMP